MGLTAGADRSPGPIAPAGMEPDCQWSDISAEMDRVRIALDLFASDSRSFAVRLWDGTVLPPVRDAGVRGTLVLRTPRALDALLPPAAEHRLAEAFLDGALYL